MNNTLYTQLAPLGFAEWLENNDFAGVIDDLEFTDTATIDSVERTGLNALAFRWLREERKLLLLVSPVDDWTSWTFIILAKDLMSPFFHAFPRTADEIPEYPTHELAEHHALNKALEIINNQNK